MSVTKPYRFCYVSPTGNTLVSFYGDESFKGFFQPIVDMTKGNLTPILVRNTLKYLKTLPETQGNAIKYCEEKQNSETTYTLSTTNKIGNIATLCIILSNKKIVIC